MLHTTSRPARLPQPSPSRTWRSVTLSRRPWLRSRVQPWPAGRATRDPGPPRTTAPTFNEISFVNLALRLWWLDRVANFVIIRGTRHNRVWARPRRQADRAFAESLLTGGRAER